MFINEKICFIEQPNEKFVFVDKDNATFQEKYLISNEINFIEEKDDFDKQLKIAIPGGVLSKLFKNNIVNFPEYKKDASVLNKGEFISFNENAKDMNIDCINHYIVKKTIGTESSEDFDDLFLSPFQDLENLEVTRNFKDVYYPNYYNAYSSQRFHNSISILGQIDEVRGSLTTTSSLLGIDSNICNNGEDARGRQIFIKDVIQIIEDNNTDLLRSDISEPFLEEEVVFDKNATLVKRKFKYEEMFANGVTYRVLKNDAGSFSYVPLLSRNIAYISEENNNILPFNDSIEEIKTLKLTSGIDTDNSIQINSESIAFAGEID
jgi:hypothetical protein